MKFIKATREILLDDVKKKSPNKKLKNDLLKFLATGYEYAEVEDDEHYYNNNNDLYRSIKSCIEHNHLPITAFMFRGVTYVQKL